MKNCQQTENQSIYQHGISVRDHAFQLINYLETGIIIGNWKLPEWLASYNKQILHNLMPKDIIEEYTVYHDCGKAYCLSFDENGRKHFINHAELSYLKWLEVGGSKEAATLMKMDMDIHKLKDYDVDEFCKRPQAITLLLVGLAEIISNSIMFGGFNSINFKIKFKQIDKRGKRICKILFGENV